MSEISNSASAEGEVDGALELRVFRAMIAAVSLAVIASVALASWRVTTGLFLGGTLALLNYHWLRTSIAAVLGEAPVKRPRLKISSYAIRYFVISAVVIASYKLQIVSLPATIVGLCAFVPALFVEAFRQVYFAIIHREETF